MTTFLNSVPTTKDDAVKQVAMLTGVCSMSIRELPNTTDPRKAAVMIARFQELNEVRCRIIRTWGLERFAAGLLAK